MGAEQNVDADLDALRKLRDSWQPKLGELREQGAEAGQRLRQHVDKMHAEIAELVQRLGAKRH